eukprot:2830617-Heterocapsa_arctica.AAC.1
MSSITMILSAELTRPWSSTVSATDASLSGMGVCQAAAPLNDVRAAGVWQEKWRYRRLDPSEWAPRKRALGKLCELTDPRTVRECVLPEDRQWAMREGFPEVPPAVLSDLDWRTVYAGLFNFTKHIKVKEGRAFLWALHHAARDA